MKFLLLSLLFFSSASQAVEKFNVIWWNVGGGNYYQNITNNENCYADEGRNLILLQQNILKLARTNPDVLILGEMYEGFFSEQTMQKLSKIFPSLRKYRYNERDFRPLEIWIFTKQKLADEKYLFEELHWIEDRTEQRTEQSTNTNFLRSYQRITLEFAGKKINIVPVHAVDPWPEMRGDRGLLRTGLNLLFSEQNANYIQTGFLRRALYLDVLQNQTGEATLLLGDFNIPNHFLGVVPRAYARLESGLSVIPLNGKTKHTFPAASCFHYKKMPKLQIDHAFVSSLQGTAVGTIRGEMGSDHFPIQVQITDRQK